MAIHRDAGARTPPPSVNHDPLGYWWPVCRGPEIMRAFHAAAEHDAWTVVERHPALLLPEIVDAAERALGASRALAGLREMHHALRGSPAWAPYQRLLAGALASERRGSRRVNLERALAVIQAVRQAAPGDPADDRAERSICQALAALTPLPGAVAPSVPAMFLDEAELPGLRRGDDRRGQNLHRHDRGFAVGHGLAAGWSEWLGRDDAPVHRVIDARWVFASTKAARAYLESPGTQQLARDGLANPAVLSIGDGAYAWGAGASAPGRARQCLLFRVDRVVARIDVEEGPRAAEARQALARTMVVPFAEAAVGRIRRVLAQYWLGIGGGAAAARRFVDAPPRTAAALFTEHPILLLPELPVAMGALGDAYRAGAERLAVLQGALRGDWGRYRDVLRALIRALLDERAGEPRVNADAALRLVTAHRRLDSDYAWAGIESECAARAAGAP